MKQITLILVLSLAAFGQSTAIQGDRTIRNLSVAGAFAPPSGTSDPTACTQGDLFFRTDTNTLRKCTVTGNPGTWADAEGSGSSVTPGYGILSEGGAVTWNPTDPRYLIRTDEFVSGTASAGSYGIGDLRWRFGNNGTCTLYLLSPGTFTNYGVFQLGTGTTANNSCWFNHQSSASGPTMGSPYTNSDKLIDMKWIFSIGSTADVRVQAGFQELNSGDPPGDDGIFWRYDSATDTNWTLATVDGGTPSVAASTVAVDTNFHTFRIYSDGATANKLYASVDGGTALTICASACDITTNIPTENMQPFIIIRTLTAATKWVYIDAFLMRVKVGATEGKRN